MRQGKRPGTLAHEILVRVVRDAVSEECRDSDGLPLAVDLARLPEVLQAPTAKLESKL